MASPVVDFGETRVDEAAPFPLPQLDLLLASGGARDIWPDLSSRRTPWGTTVAPASHEIWFSSTAAQSISRPAYDETAAVLDRLLRQETAAPLAFSSFFDALRGRIASVFGAPEARVVLAASAAEARDCARVFASLLLRREVIEIATTADECTHFRAPTAPGFGAVTVDLRSATGDPREQTDIDTDAMQLCEAALESGHGAFIHCLDTSKTGLCGISRGAARAVIRAAPGRALALVDASEGRIYPGEVRRDIAHGAMVLVTGSQFIGGPPFSAALLLPAEMVEAIADTSPALDLPIARFDAPRELRPWLSVGGGLANPGLGLRWTAALRELEDYLAIDEQLRRDILEAFSRKARIMAARCGFVTVEASLVDNADDPLRESIVSIIPLTPGGPRLAVEYAGALRDALARPCCGLEGDALCHIGHPVPVGNRVALPLSASAPMVREVARRMDMGLGFDRAMTPVLRDLGTLLRKWEALAG